MKFLPFACCLSVIWSGAARADWLDLRRQGVEAELAAARKASVPEPWLAKYVADLPKAHPLAGLTIVVARAPSSNPHKPGDVLARIEGVAALRGVGVALHAGQVTLRLPGQKATAATNLALFTDLPLLQVPLAVFVATEAEHLFTFQNEGEFGDVAVLRLLPRYERGGGLQPLKVGLSKRYQAFAQSEVTDREGRPLGGLLWQEPRLDKGLVVWQELRLRAKGSEAVVPLRLLELKRGKAAGKLVFDANAWK